MFGSSALCQPLGYRWGYKVFALNGSDLLEEREAINICLNFRDCLVPWQKKVMQGKEIENKGRGVAGGIQVFWLGHQSTMKQGNESREREASVFQARELQQQRLLGGLRGEGDGVAGA